MPDRRKTRPSKPVLPPAPAPGAQPTPVTNPQPPTQKKVLPPARTPTISPVASDGKKTFTDAQIMGLPSHEEYALAKDTPLAGGSCLFTSLSKGCKMVMEKGGKVKDSAKWGAECAQYLRFLVARHLTEDHLQMWKTLSAASMQPKEQKDEYSFAKQANDIGDLREIVRGRKPGVSFLGEETSVYILEHALDIRIQVVTKDEREVYTWNKCQKDDSGRPVNSIVLLFTGSHYDVLRALTP